MNSNKTILTSLAFLMVVSLTGCMTVVDHRQALKDSSDEKITLGVAQREIREGMSQAEVAKALGSPNMVTKDRDGIETWIYDKVSTETAYSTSKNGMAGLVLGTGAIIGGGVGSTSQASGASSRTQRTLTIIIKFKKSAVSEFTYNSTSF
jgi:outer membrane protein assembly factor BamE (lipoprotein component of BamABCDE complex)